MTLLQKNREVTHGFLASPEAPLLLHPRAWVPDRPPHHLSTRDPQLDDPRASVISRGFARHPGLKRSRRVCKRGILVRQLFNLYRIPRASWVWVSFTLLAAVAFPPIGWKHLPRFYEGAACSCYRQIFGLQAINLNAHSLVNKIAFVAQV